MKSLSKTQCRERDELAQKLRDAADTVDTAVSDYNAAAGAAFVAVCEAVEKYNERLTEAQELTNTIAADAQTYLDERSEKYQESDAGADYQNWQQEWESADFDPIEIDPPDGLETPELDHADALESLPDSVR